MINYVNDLINVSKHDIDCLDEVPFCQLASTDFGRLVKEVLLLDLVEATQDFSSLNHTRYDNEIASFLMLLREYNHNQNIDNIPIAAQALAKTVYQNSSVFKAYIEGIRAEDLLFI